jgi:anti-sigma regulatory factor (Ser/Thr protein kinase)
MYGYNMRMQVHLSNQGYLRHFDVFLSGFDPSDPSTLQITTNDRWISVHPAILTLVAALGLNVGTDNIKIDEITAKSGHYLDTMGLFKILGKKSPFKVKSHDPTGRFIPLTQIKTPEQQTHFIHDIIPLLHLRPQQADAIKYTIGELVRNVLEHSKSPYGAVVAAQYSQEKGVIRLGICDTGIGIKNSMHRIWPSHTQTDIDAIKWALVPGVTGTTMRHGGTAENAGAGLFFVKSISMVTRSYFLIYSGSGVFKLLKRRPDVRSIKLNADPEQDRNSQVDDAPSLPGTLIAIDISLENIDEFASLLSLIRSAYFNAVKERKAERYKPRFI